MNRRTALKALSSLTAAAFAPLPETRAIARADLQPAPNDPDRLLLLSAVWEAIDALREIETSHRDCDCDHCTFEAAGMLFHLTSYESLLEGEVVWTDAATRSAAAERKRRRDYAKSGAFDCDPSFRVLVALNGFRDALADVPERHEDCSCRLCRDVWAMHWQMEIYASIWSGSIPAGVVLAAEELAGAAPQ